MEKYKILDINVDEPLPPEHIVIKEEVILPEPETDADEEVETEYDNSNIPGFQLELIKEEEMDDSLPTEENDPLASESTSDLLNGNFCFVSLHKGINIEEMLSCKICRRLKNDHKWRCSFVEEGSKYKYGFYCQECNTKIKTQKDYIQHMSSAHNIKKSHECEVCNQGLKRLIALNAHPCAKNRHETYKCVECSQMLQQQISLKFHLFIHAHNKPLGYHLKKEESQKWVQCEKCKKKFSTQWHLKRHLSNFHSTQKCYQCFVCQGTFKFKNLLKIHLQDHLKLNKTESNPENSENSDDDSQHFQSGMSELLETNNLPDATENLKIELVETEAINMPYYETEMLGVNEPSIIGNLYSTSDIIQNPFEGSESSNAEHSYINSESMDNIPLENFK